MRPVPLEPFYSRGFCFLTPHGSAVLSCHTRVLPSPVTPLRVVPTYPPFFLGAFTFQVLQLALFRDTHDSVRTDALQPSLIGNPRLHSLFPYRSTPFKFSFPLCSPPFRGYTGRGLPFFKLPVENFISLAPFVYVPFPSTRPRSPPAAISGNIRPISPKEKPSFFLATSFFSSSPNPLWTFHLNPASGLLRAFPLFAES